MVNELVTSTRKILVISLGGKDTEYAALRDYFMQEGYEASFVYNERDLYGLLENKKCFDVILLDVERKVDKLIVAMQSLKRYCPQTVVIPVTKGGQYLFNRCKATIGLSTLRSTSSRITSK